MGLEMLGGLLLGGSALASAYSAYKQGKAAEKQADAANAIANEQAALAREQWKQYQDTYVPLQNQVVGEVSRPLENQGYFARMMGQVDKGYSDAEASVRRSMGGQYQYGSGLTDAKLQSLDLGRARAKAGATADAETNRLKLMMSAAGMGSGLPGSALSGLNSASGTKQNLAGMYGNAAASGWSSLGNTAGNLTQMYMMNKMMNAGGNPYTTGGVSNGYDVLSGAYGPVFN